MSKVVTDLLCTCGSVSMWARNHDAEKCDLWLDDDFANEEAIWSTHDRTLKEAPIDWHPVEPARTKGSKLPPIEESVKRLVQGEDLSDDPRWEAMPGGGFRYVGEKGVTEKEQTKEDLEEARRQILFDMNPDDMTDEEWWELEMILQREHNHVADTYSKTEKKDLTVPPKAVKKLVCTCNPMHTWICRKIEATRKGKDHEWVPMTPEEKVSYGVDEDGAASSVLGGKTTVIGKHGTKYTTGDWDSATYMPKCRHNGAVVEFPDGTKVWASSSGQRKPADPTPTMGVYMADSWKPKWPFFRIPWTDYDLPEGDFHTVAWVIETAFQLAVCGDDIEVGCIGGHGRTGTVLACMAVLGGVEGDKAVEWVKKNYCTEAIEGERQQWFVQWFDATHRGVEPPKMPEKKVWTSTTDTSVTCMEKDHFVLIEKGERCWLPHCEWWEKDVEAYIKKHGAIPEVKVWTHNEKSSHTKKTHEYMLTAKHECGCRWWDQDTKGVVPPKTRSPRHQPGRSRRRNQKRRSRRQHSRSYRSSHGHPRG